MGDKTKIEWTEATWNPVTGCDKVSPGCDHCYAESVAHRFAGTKAYPDGFAVTLRPERLEWPIRKTKPQRIFVNSMSDLFHDQVPDEYIARVWAVMALAPRHTFQILTKRHGRMKSLVGSERFAGLVYMAVNAILAQGNPPKIADDTIVAALDGFARGQFTVLPNVHGGVSAEDQQRAALRIPALNATPFAVRFVSAEPLLGRIEMDPEWLPVVCGNCDCDMGCHPPSGGIDWVIVGGESGAGARPMHPDWARSLRDQCTEAGVAFLFKQWGEWVEDVTIRHAHGTGEEYRLLNVPPDHKNPKRCAMHSSGGTAMTADNPFNPFRAGHGGWTAIRRAGKKLAGRELDGRTWDEYPAGVSVR